jgi:uncharacterized protein YggE
VKIEAIEGSVQPRGNEKTLTITHQKGAAMKRALIPILMAGLLSIVHLTFAQAPPVLDRRVIFTEGTAELVGQNDSANIFVAVVAEGKNLEQTSTENASRTKRVIQAIKALNIKNLKLKTSNYRVTPQKDHKVRPPKIKGYEVHNAIEVSLEGLEPEQLSKQVSQIVEKAVESGANTIDRLQFYIKDKEPLEKEALTQATQQAMERARTLAQGAGVKLKRIVSLSTHPIHMPPGPVMFGAGVMKAEATAAAPPIEIGESRVRVQVSVAYEME